MVAVIVQIVRLWSFGLWHWILYMDMNVAEECTVLVFSIDVTLNMIRGSLFLYNGGI